MRCSLSLLLPLLLSQLALLCHASSLVQAEYWPAYTAGVAPAEPFAHGTKLAYYFCLVTSPTGIAPNTNPGSISAFVAAAHARGAKALISLGGWSGSIYFSDLASTAAGRTSLASQLHGYVVEYGADGVDIDWEYPNSDNNIGCNSKRPADTANFILLLQQLRKLMGTAKMITAPLGTSVLNGANGKPLTNVKALAAVLDVGGIMSYDLVGTWDTYTASASPLKTCGSDSSVESAVAAWIHAGFPAAKILAGIPAYATSFTTLSSTLSTTTVSGVKTQIRQKMSKVLPQGSTVTDLGPRQPTTDACGVTTTTYTGQYQVRELISQGLLSADYKTGLGGYKRYFDSCSSTPFLFSAAKRHFITYEDPTSVAAKAKWAKAQKLMGVMIYNSDGFTAPVYSSLASSLKK